MKIRDYRSEGSIRVVPPGLHTMDHQVPPISLLLWCKSLIPTWNRTSGHSWHLGMLQEQPRANEEYWERQHAQQSARFGKVCFTASPETLLHHHTLLPAERAAVKQMLPTGNFTRGAALNPNGHWAARSRLRWSCHCRKKQWQKQVTLPPLTVWHWPRRIWLSWQDHSKCSFSSPLPRWPAAPQLPWEAG